MNWNEIKNLRIDHAAKMINSLLKKNTLSSLSIELGVDKLEINNFFLDNKYIYKEDLNIFEKSKYVNLKGQDDPQDLTKFTAEEIRTLKRVANLYSGDMKNIRYNIPEGKIINKSFRVNETVWNEFTEFSKEVDHKSYELISMALYEFMNKYKK